MTSPGSSRRTGYGWSRSGAVVVYVPLLQQPGERARVGPDLAGRRCRWSGRYAASCLAMVLLYSRAAVPFLYFQF